MSTSTHMQRSSQDLFRHRVRIDSVTDWVIACLAQLVSRSNRVGPCLHVKHVRSGIFSCQIKVFWLWVGLWFKNHGSWLLYIRCIVRVGFFYTSRVKFFRTGWMGHARLGLVMIWGQQCLIGRVGRNLIASYQTPVGIEFEKKKLGEMRRGLRLVLTLGAKARSNAGRY